MKIDSYLQFLHKAIVEKRIYEESKIVRLDSETIIPQKQILKLKSREKFVILNIQLEENKTLLVEDLPQNFLLSHSILVGDKTQLYSFKFKDSSVQTYAQKSILDRLNGQIQQDTINLVNPKELSKQTFYFNFQELEHIKKIRRFVKKENNIDLFKLHIISGNTIENFIPTIKQKHFRLAHKLEIPRISLTKDNYVLESNVNILDVSSMIDYLKPIQIFRKEVISEFDSKTKHKLHKDLRKEIYFKVDSDEIKEKLEHIKNTNISTKSLFPKIDEINRIQLSNQNSNMVLPIFKVLNIHKYVKFKNMQEFKQITGVNFELKKNKLKDIFIQSLEGKQAKYLDKYLNSSLENTIKTLDESSKIEFSSLNELIIKTYYKKEIDFLIKEETPKKDKIQTLSKKISDLGTIIILYLIDLNKMPNFTRTKNLREKYFIYKINKLEKLEKDYLQFPKKQKLLSNTLDEIEEIYYLLKKIGVKEENSYYFFEFYRKLLNLLSHFDLEKSIQLKNHLNEFFSSVKPTILKNVLNEEYEKLFKDILLINSIQKDKNKTKRVVNIVLKENFEDINSIIDTNLITTPNVNRIYLKPKENKIEEIFPYISKEVILEIKNLNRKISNKQISLEEIESEDFYLEVRGRILRNIKILYDKFPIYKNYKTIAQNKFFDTILELN